MDKEIFIFIRTSNQLSRAKFAKAIGVSTSLITRIEGGDRRITESVVNRVMQAFDLTEEKIVSMRLLISEILN